MTAFCRVFNELGQPRLAIEEKINGVDRSEAIDARICCLESLLGDAEAARWEHGNAFCELTAETIASWPTPREDQWLPRPSRWLPPVIAPEKVICIGLNYRDHAVETGAELPTEPIVFSKFASSLIGPGGSIVLPKISQQVDFEAELVVVIGRQARDITADDALKHVFGYTVGHDVSARDWQKGRPGGQWLLAKTFDTFAPIGPSIVTADEVGEPCNLQVAMEINGQTMQNGTTADLIFDIPTLIAHVSQFVTLRPGDLLFTGTPAGVGAARKPQRFLKPGDHCEVVIKGIGRLANQVVAHEK